MSTRTHDRPRGRRRRAAGALVAIAIIVLVLAGVVYVLQQSEIEIDVERLEAAVEKVKESSEEAAVTAKVKSALALSKSVSAFDIDVDTREGVVTLSGEVPSTDVKALAARIASDTTGVRRVENNLAVASAPPPKSEDSDRSVADLQVRAAVYEKLLRDRDLDAHDISVSVEDGVVTLRGSVPSEEDRRRAERLAASVEGASSVVNALTFQTT